MEGRQKKNEEFWKSRKPCGTVPGIRINVNLVLARKVVSIL